MGIDVNELFTEKNQSLFFNKLIMDLENNTEAFKKSGKNIVHLEIAKLLTALKKIYADYSVDIDDEGLKNILLSLKNGVLEDLYTIIDDKHGNNKKYIDESKNKSINDSYMKKYGKHIDDGEKNFESNWSLAIRELADVKLYSSLIELHTCSSEDMHFDLLNVINIDFSENLFNRIVDESNHRNMTLKNISEETYQKYRELTQTSITNNTASKQKVKKDN